MPKLQTIASAVLKRALIIVEGRRGSYGTPKAGMGTVARLWSVILAIRVEPWQVALCLDALKTARIIENPGHLDSWLDKCGYSAIGAELAPMTREHLKDTLGIEGLVDDELTRISASYIKEGAG